MDSVVSAEVLVPPQTDPASPSSADFEDPMAEFSRRLDDIVQKHQNPTDGEKLTEAAAADDVAGYLEAETSLIMSSLSKLSTPEEKLQHLIRKHVQLAASQRSSVAARAALESLCKDLQLHYNTLREETLRRCKEEEERRTDMTSHFQTVLTEIQEQIEQHSLRNTKLCRENSSLTEKLESLMSQCEHREENLEKLNRHRDLQLKLSEAKLQQAEALLVDAGEKHKREKEYLLREAIDKTKKCFAMKEQELAMKKKLTLYSQKFDEFQETLAKSNLIYARFKKEMDNMSEKMKKLEKESNVWKTRFENCNKALTDMIQERTEKTKEYDIFVLKIQKLERLCRALQDERKVLYDKIREVRHVNAGLPKLLGITDLGDDPEVDDKPRPALEAQEVQELMEDDLVLTQDMARLKEEQAKLQEFAISLLEKPSDDEEAAEDLNPEEDAVASSFAHFRTKRAKEESDTVGAQENVNARKTLSEPTPTEPEGSETQAGKVPEEPQPEIEMSDIPAVKPVTTEIQVAPIHISPEEPAVSAEPLTLEEPTTPAITVQPETHARPAEPEEPADHAEPAAPVTPVEPAKVTVEAPAARPDAPPSKKEAPKKKKKRNNKNAS